MNIIIMGAAGFIGTNLLLRLSLDEKNFITLVDKDMNYFDSIKKFGLKNVKFVERQFNDKERYDDLMKNVDIVYHLVSSSTPTTSNQNIAEEIRNNLIFTANLLEDCKNTNIKRVIFISSGGTVYGKEINCPIKESAQTNPINSYGFQKLAIEKLFYLYNCMYGIDYKIIRLANPYGPYQRPNGKLGAVTTFIYKAIQGENINLYGDGSVVRDYVYISDVIDAVINISCLESDEKIFNVGSGKGVSLNQLLNIISETLNTKVSINHLPARSVDVPVNYLDISLYKSTFGVDISKVSFSKGIIETANYLRNKYL
ncbi:NAD-dependent epimerase/dehydratase family protein [Selenomonas ruminantium]|uniref:NAD-dependent epimerase/dehydratase family protein n=1 Tax=Selenomonas ruminantium TaxID=971 RepID=UPI0015680CC6|nr:NAD-dependent epimerase/dehydratase family protein [Selenomonas ruminantium]